MDQKDIDIDDDLPVMKMERKFSMAKHIQKRQNIREKLKIQLFNNSASKSNRETFDQEQKNQNIADNSNSNIVDNNSNARKSEKISNFQQFSLESENQNLTGNSQQHKIFKFTDTNDVNQQESLDEQKIGIKHINGTFYNLYREINVLGEGCVGLVLKCERISDQQMVAVKIVKTRDAETIFNIKYEFKNIKKINHPNIVSVYELYIDIYQGCIYTVMELVDFSELFQVIEKIKFYSEDVAKKIFQQILKGIKYMHSQGICHRDIKPNNILVSEDGSVVKITDFNVSKFATDFKAGSSNQHIKMWTYTGTIAFSAPEVFGDDEYNEQVDMWSAGCVLYTMLAGEQPFNAEYIDDLIQQIKIGVYDMEENQVWKEISDDAKDLIRKCLTVNPEQRINPRDALQHKWIQFKIYLQNQKQQSSKSTSNSLVSQRLKLTSKQLSLNKGHLVKRESDQKQKSQDEDHQSQSMQRNRQLSIFKDKNPFQKLKSTEIESRSLPQFSNLQKILLQEYKSGSEMSDIGIFSDVNVIDELDPDMEQTPHQQPGQQWKHLQSISYSGQDLVNDEKMNIIKQDIMKSQQKIEVANKIPSLQSSKPILDFQNQERTPKGVQEQKQKYESINLNSMTSYEKWKQGIGK